MVANKEQVKKLTAASAGVTLLTGEVVELETLLDKHIQRYEKADKPYGPTVTVSAKNLAFLKATIAASKLLVEVVGESATYNVNVNLDQREMSLLQKIHHAIFEADWPWYLFWPAYALVWVLRWPYRLLRLVFTYDFWWAIDMILIGGGTGGSPRDR